jgi:hypothetical protein
VNTNFCPYPWLGLDIDTQMQLRPCCKFGETIATNIDEYFASDRLKQIQSQFLNNEKPKACSACWDEEAAGKPSKRLIDIEHVFNNRIDDLSKVKALSIPFGNTCNLSCRTCHSKYSSKWISDEKQLSSKFTNIEIFQHNKYYKDADFLKKIFDLSQDIIEVTFWGGETFIAGIEEQLQYLEFLLQGSPQNIKLNYITNCTTIPQDKFWEKWSKFKTVNIILSVDGIGKKFEYLRYPASWPEVYQNIKTYQKKASEEKNIMLSVNHVVSVLNVLDIHDFQIWCLKEKLSKPHFTLAKYPDYLDLRNLPKEIKSEISGRLNHAVYGPILNYIDQPGLPNVAATLEWINEIDKLRSQNFGEIFPEMAYLLTKNKY